ncbi:LysM peptidoglycan-binding domain-containing protein [bacterium]|nr:LysM peptidoglycan-binding domain-containing protein [bacterium]
MRHGALGLGVLLLLSGIAPVAGFAGSARPDTLVHTVRSGDTLIEICGTYRDRTNHYSLDDLLKDIRRANGLTSNFLRIGQELKVPVLPDEPVAQVRRRVRDGEELRGMYLTGPACGVSSVLGRVDAFVAAGGNAVVFDAKDIDGGVSFHSRHPLASWGKGRSAPVISSLDDMMARFDRRGLYTVARLALFLDGELGHRRPDLALQDSTGNPWGERGCVWMDPAQPEVREYNLALAAELARAGVDEIQFDYVRFPTNGWRGDWVGDLEHTALRRRAVISDFLAVARDTLAAYGVKVSADLYGIMAWGRMEDLALTGQHVPTIAGLVDVICPMIYPSHFGPGFEGRKRPGDDPDYFIGEGTRRFVAQVAGQAEIRPWLQAFPYRVTKYDGAYIATQVGAARDAGGRGWCLWNPACRYGEALDVLPALSGAVPGALTLAEPDAPAAGMRRAPARGLVQPVLPQGATAASLAPVQGAGIQ